MKKDKREYVITNTIMYKDYINAHPDAGEEDRKSIVRNFISNLVNDTDDIKQFFIVTDDDMKFVNDKKYNITYEILSDDEKTLTMTVNITLSIDITENTEE